MPAPRLPVLGPGGVTHDARPLTAGAADRRSVVPRRPNSPNRFDADLLRIRKIGVTHARADRPSTSLRGPASVAVYTWRHVARAATDVVPDQEVRFDVTPRNLNLGR